MFCKKNIAFRLVFLFVFFITIPDLRATHWPFRTGARSAGLSGISLCNTDVWSVQNNQAAMAFASAPSLGIDFANPFLLRELSRVNMSAILPLKNMQFGLNINQMGFDIWQENKLGIALSRKLGTDWSMGVGVHYHSTRYNDPFFPNLQGASAELGLLYKYTDRLYSAFHILQPMAYFRQDKKDRFIRPQARAGLAYSLYDQLKIFGEAAITDQAPVSTQIAMEYQYGSALDFRLSYQFQPDQLAFGFGYQLGESVIDAAFSWHPQLGFTPSVSLSHVFQ